MQPSNQASFEAWPRWPAPATLQAATPTSPDIRVIEIVGVEEISTAIPWSSSLMGDIRHRTWNATFMSSARPRSKRPPSRQRQRCSARARHGAAGHWLGEHRDLQTIEHFKTDASAHGICSPRARHHQEQHCSRRDGKANVLLGWNQETEMKLFGRGDRPGEQRSGGVAAALQGPDRALRLSNRAFSGVTRRRRAETWADEPAFPALIPVRGVYPTAAYEPLPRRAASATADRRQGHMIETARPACSSTSISSTPPGLDDYVRRTRRRAIDTIEDIEQYPTAST